MSRKYLLRTLGCKVNQYESQQLREILESHGLRAARPGQTPEIAVVNSCAVTGSASAKTRQAVRRLSDGGTVPVVVVGCGATAEADRLGQIPGVVALWGHQDGAADELRRFLVHRLNSGPGRSAGLPDAAARGDARLRTGGDDAWMKPILPAQGKPVGSATDPNPVTHISVAPSPADVNAGPAPGTTIHRFDGHQRAFLKVQDGCDAHCSYCIIPRLRPLLSSKPISVAVEEACTLVDAGHREIVLTGIYLGAYGRATALRRRFNDRERSPLAELVDALARVEGLARLRLSSLEPGDVDDDLLSVLAAHDCCVPHLHLPLQSGSSTVLRRMNRQYDADDYRDMIGRVQAALDRPAISTDVVVGFPGETEDDFDQTLAVAEETGLCKIHAFPFSPRAGTAAARWKSDFVAPAIVRRRMQRLQQLERQTARRFRGQAIGTVERVLVERGRPDGESHDPNLLHGRTDRYFEVFFAGSGDHCPEPGGLAHVRIDRVNGQRVYGTLVPEPSPSRCFFSASNTWSQARSK